MIKDKGKNKTVPWRVRFSSDVAVFFTRYSNPNTILTQSIFSLNVTMVLYACKQPGGC